MMRSVLFFCALAGIPLTLCSCGGKTTSTFKAGEHNVVVIKRASPFKTGVSLGSVGADGSFSYEYRDLKVTLENEVLTVNSKRYIIPHKDDSIKVIDGRAGIKVEINGQLAKPERGP
jgi:hypothetical protein